MGIEDVDVLYFERLSQIPEETTMPSKTPEPPNEPDVFEDENVNATEDEADFDAEETNEKETE